MNLLTVSVTKPSQIEPGAFYLLCGTTQGGKVPIPPQVIQVLTKPYARTLLEDPTFDVMMWINMGPVRVPPTRITMGMREINVPEHGLHDRHLRRVSDEVVKALEALDNLNKKVRYEDLATDLSSYKANGRAK